MNFTKTALGAASILAAAAFAGPVLADGMPSRGRIANAQPARTCATSANVGVTSDYVFRGISQNDEEAAIQGGVDFTCGKFYAGFWGSSVSGGTEIDLVGGYRTNIGRFALDLGFIYYTYHGGNDLDDANTLELKAGASTEVWKGGTVGVTGYFQVGGDYFATGLDDAVTVEGSFSQALPKFSIFTPTASVVVGHSYFDESDADYTYWNAGVTLGFLEKWSLDLRYHDTDIDPGGFAPVTLADERFVATLKYTF